MRRDLDSLLVEYYNKFNEDKRLKSRHGQVEFNTTMHFIKEAVESIKKEETTGTIENAGITENVGTTVKPTADGETAKILEIADIGAGTGGYTIPLLMEGHNVTAVELVKYNLGILKKNAAKVLGQGLQKNTCANSAETDVAQVSAIQETQYGTLTAYNGNALKLKKLKDNSYDITLLLGPMYHLHSAEDKVKALKEAKRITKPGGYIFVAYVMADYAVVKYGFVEKNIRTSIANGDLNEDYSIKSNENELYDYVRLSDIDEYNKAADLERVKIVAPDGPADYIRNVLNDMDEETFQLFLDYQIKNAERADLLGASSHTLDVLKK